MIPEWVWTVLIVYIVIDLSVGSYFKYKYQGPYSDGKVHIYTMIPFTTIPYILYCKITGRNHIKVTPGVHKISWKQYKEMKKVNT